MFSRRTSWKRQANRLTEIEHSLRAAGREILDLTESNPTRAALPIPEETLAAVRSAIARPESLRYEPSPRGLSKARDAVSRYYAERGIAVSPERILLTASTSEAYSCLLKLLADQGDRVLVPAPSYPLFDFLADLEGVALDTYPLHYDGRFWIDTAELARRVTGRSRAIIAVSPNNPTGSYLKVQEVQFLLDLCSAHGLALIVDEVFSDYLRDPALDLVLSVAGRESNALTFVLSGVSKVLGLPQVKLAWMTVNGPAVLVEEAMERLDIVLDTYLSVATPIQHALPDLLALRPVLQNAIVARVTAGAAAVGEALARRTLIRVLHTEGGWYSVLRLPATRGEEEWVQSFLEEDAVLLHPGFFFDFSSGPYVVLSLLTPTGILRDGLDRVLARVEASA